MSFNQALFQEKMRSLINGASLVDFAAGCGLSRSNLTRLLSDNNDTPPRKGTLKKIADYTGTDIEELLSICGYSVSPASVRKQKTFSERARLNACDLENGFNELTKGTQLYPSIKDFIDTYSMLYSYESCKYLLFNRRENYGDMYPEAENTAILSATFSDMEGTCYTFSVIYFSETKGGKVVISGISMDGKSLEEAGFAADKYSFIPEKNIENIPNMDYVYFISESYEQRLLKSIFGEGELKKYPYTSEGFGFYIDSVPVKFREFLENHKDICPDDSEIIDEFLCSSCDDPEEFFQNYKCDGRKKGFGPLIAKIMAAESGYAFKYYRSEPELSDEPPVIMVENYDKIGNTEDDREENFSNVMDYTLKYAKELGIKKYGERHVFKYSYESNNLQFEVEEDK